ncbi:MAG: glycoside hydrolase family 99-like domain-containing protein, partial [Anaerolineae bacterium]|nr:glycoside hydrolase family 99-like domain-containing protein [Anaerolineae bacterium]
TYLARTYLDHPNYLRTEGRPVLFLYLTRAFTGDIQSTMDAVREAVRAEVGEPAFIIGDEVYWQSPSSLRIGPYDGVTAYNMHTSVPGIAEGFAGKVAEQYASWARKTATEGVAFIPDILPGFDDTGVRPEAEHPVIPRDEESFATQLKDAIALAHGPIRMVMITSFNEWHEFTSVEPGEPFGLAYLEIVKEAVATEENTQQ